MAFEEGKENSFRSLKDIIDTQRRHLFDLLENDDKNSEFFVSKCNEYGGNVVINARDRRNGYDGRTLLHSSASLGFKQAVCYLIGIGVDINMVDSSR